MKEDKSDFFTEPKDFNKNVNWLTAPAEGKFSQLGANTAQTLTDHDADQTDLTELTEMTGQTDAWDTGTKNGLEGLEFLKGFDEDDSDMVNVVEKEAGSAIDKKNLLSHTRRFKNEQPLYSSSYSSSYSSPFSSPFSSSYSSPYSSSYSYAGQQPQKG